MNQRETHRAKVRWFGRYTKARRLLNQLERELKQAREERLYPTMRFGTRVKTSTTADTVAETAQRLDELQRRRDSWEATTRALWQETNAAIDKVQNPVGQAILRAHFLQGLPMEQIGPEVGYSTTHIYRLYKAAMEEVTLPGRERAAKQGRTC